MPKPGYYYYRNVRALRALFFLFVFSGGLFLAKNSPPLRSTEEVLMFLHQNRYAVTAFLLGLIGALWVKRRIEMFWYEPKPRHYRSREAFIGALDRYARRHSYMHGWVYHRGNELWPEP